MEIEIIEVTSKGMLDMIVFGSYEKKRYLCQEGNNWIAMDATRDESFVEEFKTREEAVDYLSKG